MSCLAVPVNEAQRAVLDWLAAGGSQDPLRPEMKLSAVALAGRALVKVRRPGGRWTAELTDAGRYYVEHGRYPGEPERDERPAAPAEEPEPLVNLAGAPVAGPLRQVIRRPHPAVRELRDQPGRLPTPLRRRCVLVAHSLVTEALALGWTVTPVEARRESDGYRGTYLRYGSQALLLLDAGHAAVGIVFSEVTRRRPHEDTKEEAERRAKGQYVWAPTYDYVGDGRLRLHLTDREGRKTGVSWTDGARVKVEDRLAEVIGAVEAASERAVRFEEARRRREAWEEALHAGADAWARHCEMAAFVDEVERVAGKEGHPFVEWARGHLEAVDPRRPRRRATCPRGRTRSAAETAGTSRNRRTAGDVGAASGDGTRRPETLVGIAPSHGAR